MKKKNLDGMDSELWRNESFDEYDSNELLSQWLNSLETRSSLFWLHYVECNYNSSSDGARSNSVETQESSSAEASSTSDYADDYCIDFGDDIFAGNDINISLFVTSNIEER